MSRDRIYLLHIRDAIVRIEKYASYGHDAFLKETHWQDATIRQLEVIGEATKRLSPGLKDAHPGMPWLRIAGLRDVLIHDYMGVDLATVWDVVQNRIPELKSLVLAMLEKPEPAD